MVTFRFSQVLQSALECVSPLPQTHKVLTGSNLASSIFQGPFSMRRGSSSPNPVITWQTTLPPKPQRGNTLVQALIILYERKLHHTVYTKQITIYMDTVAFHQGKQGNQCFPCQLSKKQNKNQDIKCTKVKKSLSFNFRQCCRNAIQLFAFILYIIAILWPQLAIVAESYPCFVLMGNYSFIRFMSFPLNSDLDSGSKEGSSFLWINL